MDISVILSKGTVAVLHRDSGRVVGTGFLVRSDLIVTCAHVVEAAGCKKGEPVKVKFPLTGVCISTRTSEQLWRDPQQEDVTLLQLDSSIIEYNLPLGRSKDTYDHKFTSCGFPEPMGYTLKWEDGTIRGLTTYQSYPVIQLDIHEVAHGTSGAPVWDKEQNRVVGMITALYQENTAYMTPIETIYAVYPELEEFEDAEAAMRRLLNSALTTDELDEICINRYPSVAERFSTSTAREIKVQLLIEYCDRNNLFAELLELVRTLNPEKYRQHISERALKALGLGAVSEEPFDLGCEASRHDYEALRRAMKMLSVSLTILQETLEKFEFRDRDDLCDEIFESSVPFINLHGPSGVGKTHLLNHLQTKSSNLRTVYIDLKSDPPRESFLPEIICQLGGHQNQTAKPELVDLVNAIADLHRKPENITHIIISFDSVEERHQEVIDWLLKEDGFEINHPAFPAMLRNKGIRGNQLKLQVVVASQHPINKLDTFSSRAVDRIAVTPLKRKIDPKKDPLYQMVEDVANRSRLGELDPDICHKISNDIYYLTCGHPKCAMQALIAASKFNFVYDELVLQRIFREYVFKTIQEEMLEPLEPGLAQILWILSIFRRFDQRILGNLLERRVICVDNPALPTVGLQASQLRPKLSDTHLVDPPIQGTEGFYTLNLFLRRVLSLSMQYDNPDRFKALNHLALEIYTDLLKRGPSSGERALIFFMEMVYHSIKVLEVDSSTNVHTLKQRITRAIQNEYLPSLLRAIDRSCPDEPSDPRIRYLTELKNAWEKDVDLLETTSRATGCADYYQTLEELIHHFVNEYVN